MASRNPGISLPSLPLAAVAGVVVLLATSVSCQSGETPAATGSLSVHRFTPQAIETAGGSSAAWALFDRDIVSGWTPPASAGDAEVTVHLGESAEVAALKVFGPSPYRLSLVDSRGKCLSGPHALAALPEGWTTLALKAPLALARVTLRFERSGEGTAAIPELELWGRAASLPLAWEPTAFPSGEEPLRTLAEVVPTAPESERLSHEPTRGLAGCATFSFDIARQPGTYRRAWLRYHAKGVFRPLVLTRTLNSGPVMSGFWVPPTSSEVGAFIHPVDTEHLQLGRNRVEFCLPGETRGTVEISRVQFVAEFDHGSNNIESIAIAPVDAIPTQGAMSLLRENGEAVAVAAGQELVVAFERWISPDRVHVLASPEVAWTLRCVDAEAKARALPASPVEGAAGLYAVEDAGRTRCAGLRLRPSADTSVTHLRVFGSGAGRRVDFPRIVLASAREHFGQEAWVDGWARAPSQVGGGVRVSIDGREADTTTGIFASLLQRTTEPGADWPVTVTARFADGSTFTRQFVLEFNAGTLPGASSRGPGLHDGLTVEERRARFGEVGQVAEAEVAPGESKRIELGSHVAVEVPSRAMRGRKRVSLKQLDTTALPPLDPGLINVTAPARRGYEFQPHGETFDDALKVTLPYQPSLIPPGYVPEDIQTFYYDETLKRWEPLARAEVVRGREVVESLTDHFTTLLNAIVVAPEHPQAASFDPTRLKGIKAATPAAGLQLIEPPEVNSRGDAAMNYPLELPPGRLGVQPSFALSYSSARGNGWVGVGWDMGASAIEVETRWGVPRYDTGLETETYLLDGAQLSPTAHRAQPRARSQGATQFRPRVEGSFQRIIRQGSGPGRYWWEVTDKKGTRFFYGGTPESGRDSSACLTDDSGNVFRWALREIRDTHGNRVRFDYDTVTWTAPGQVPGRELYLASAHYTLRVGESTAPYRVVFLRESACASEGQSGCRPDLIVSGRGGFKQVTGERLRRVEVYYRQTLVRAWQLAYDQGPFGKSRLRQLTQLGVGNRSFPGNVHSFDYFDEVTESAGVYRGFSSAESWNAGAEDPDTGLALPAGFYDSIGEADASALGGTRTRSAGGHLYLGVAFSDKWLSVGAKTGMRQDTSEGQVALVDIDGDGLADRVFRGVGGGFSFNRNLSGPSGPPRFATQALPVEGLPALSRERSTLHLSVGPEAYVFPVQFHANLAFSSAEQDTYLSDVNADGLVDLVQGSTVHFNRLRPDGLPRFAAGDSSGTTVRLGPSAVSAEALPATFEAPGFEAELDRHSPPVDTVRVWQAPYAGRIRISGEVKLVQAQRPGADGLRASIEREGSLLWIHQFGPSETQPQRPSVEVNVAAGERLFFRLHVLQNEWDDRVHWSPLIEYLNLATYTYARHNPLRYVDPTGAFAVDWGALGEGVIDGVVTGLVVGATIGAVAVVAPAVGTAMAVVGIAALGVTAYEVATGQEVWTGRQLSDSERSYRVGSALGGTVGGVAGARVGARAVGRILQPSCMGAACDGSSELCFAAGTLVVTKDGLVPIEEIPPGILVLSRDEETGQLDWQPVLQRFITPDAEIISLTLRDDKERRELYAVTPTHPFWAQGRGWTPAGELKPGMRVLTASGTWLATESLSRSQARKTVYNLSVAQFDTYFVGALQVWVHNNGCGPTGVRPGSYTPNRTLPTDKQGVPTPDSPYPHTQLGRSKPKYGAEPQAREWDYGSNGNLQPRRDIDFSDHGTPSIHPNPHQHALTPNNPELAPKGGYQRGSAEPL